MTSPVPHAALVHHLIALGKTRSGKSSKLRVLVEDLLEQQRPVCIIDPKGDWWGLKSSADGRREGFPLVIFGGEHADVPINAHSGAHVAELVATGNRPCIIDLGGWMVGERTRFFVDFASTLFKLSKGARHLVIDEVHNFAPQGKIHDPDAGKMLHWANRLASEGAGKGISIFAASQRPQKVAKDFITSCETLIACKVIHKLDRDAIKDWIDGCADPALGKQVIADLAQLDKPEAYVWCPEIDYGPKRVAFPMFKTYDSFKPQPADAGKLKGWASVDLEDVKARLATVVEQAKARDPRELMRKIDALNKEIIALRKDQPPIYDGGAIEAAEEKGFSRGLAYGQNLANNIKVALLRMADANDTMISCMESITKQVNGDDPGAKFVYEGARAENPQRRVQPAPSQVARKGAESGSTLAGARARQIDARAPSSNVAELGKAERAILTVLAQHSDGCEAAKLTLLTGYRYTGTFRNALGSLRTTGLIEGENTATMRITDAGLSQGPFAGLPAGDALRRHWVESPHFDLAARKILSALLDNPGGLTAEQLCELTGYQYTGTFRNALGQLRTAGVLVGKNTGVMTASEELLA